MPDQIKTIKSRTETKFKEKGSLFIGLAFPVKSANEAEEILNKIKKEYYDATHHCYAYQIMENTPRYSDDGEPSGTAGIRIYNAITHFELTNILVISIRYFGGTKLGVGPLGKAYYQSAFDTLSQSSIVIKKNFLKAKIGFDYSLISKIHHYLSQYSVRITENRFEENPVIIFNIQANEYENLLKEITDATKGQSSLEIIDSDLFLE